MYDKEYVESGSRPTDVGVAMLMQVRRQPRPGRTARCSRPAATQNLLIFVVAFLMRFCRADPEA